MLRQPLSSWCLHAVRLYTRWKRLLKIIEKRFVPFFASSNNAHQELYRELGYTYKETLTRRVDIAARCYAVVIFPFFTVGTIAFIKTVWALFVKTTVIVFWKNYFHVFIWLPLILFIWGWLLPYLFYRYCFSGRRKSLSPYTNGIWIALTWVLLVYPQEIHRMEAKPFVLDTVLDKKRIGRKIRTGVFVTQNGDRYTLKHIDKALLETANIGDFFHLKGKRSRFLIHIEEIVPLNPERSK